MKRLKVEMLGESNLHQGIVLRGDKHNPEPETVTIAFPGGEVNVTRCTDGSYWAHLTTFDANAGKVVSGARTPGRIDNVRVDNRLEAVAPMMAPTGTLLDEYRYVRDMCAVGEYADPVRADAAILLADQVLDLFSDPHTYHVGVHVSRT